MQGCVEWICVCGWEGGREGGREIERVTMKRGMWNFRIRVRKGGDNEKEQRESGTGVREKGRELRGWMWAKPYVVISYLEAPSRARAIAHRCRKVARASTFWFFSRISPEFFFERTEAGGGSGRHQVVRKSNWSSSDFFDKVATTR